MAPSLACEALFHPSRKYSLRRKRTWATLETDLAGSGCRIAAFMMANHWMSGSKRSWNGLRLVKAPGGWGWGSFALTWCRAAQRRPSCRSHRGCKKLCELAADTPIRYGVENHGKITNDPAFLEKLFDGVGSDKLGLTLDVANFYWWGHPLSEVYALYERFAPRAVHTHCKSIRYPEDKRNVKREMGWEYGKYNCPIYEGDIDFKRVIEILRRAGYRGDLCVEDESLGKLEKAGRAEALKKQIRYLKDLQI